MLRSFVILVLVGSALTQSYGAGTNYQTGYQSPLNYGSNYGSNYGGVLGSTYGGSYDNSYLLNEIRALGGNTTDLSGRAGAIDTRSIPLRTENRKNSFYVDSVSQLVEEWTETITRQNEEISILELQAVKILDLWDDIEVISKTVKNLVGLKPLIEKEIKENQQFVLELKAQDQNQDADLVQVQENLNNQLKDVKDLERDALFTEEQIALLRDTLEEIKQVLDSEQAVDVSFILTSDVPVQTKSVTADFGGRLPNLQWGVYKLVVTKDAKSYVINYANNGYGSSYASNPYTAYGQPGAYGASGSYPQGSAYPQGSTYGNTYSKDYSAPLNFPAGVAYNVAAYYNQRTREVTTELVDYTTGGWKVTQVGVVVTLAYKDNSILVNYGAKYN